MMPRALGGGDDGNRHDVGRERRPGLILELGHVTAEVRLNLTRLLRWHDQIVALDPAR